MMKPWRKIIIAGSRSINSYTHVLEAIAGSRYQIAEVVSGGAAGVDQLGERWARENNIPVKRFLPDWDRYGRGAGLRRNTQMAKYADGLIAVWDGESSGTAHMIGVAQKFGLEVFVHKIIPGLFVED